MFKKYNVQTIKWHWIKAKSINYSKSKTKTTIHMGISSIIPWLYMYVIGSSHGWGYSKGLFNGKMTT